MKRPELAISRSNIPALGACLDYVPRMPNEIMPWDEATDYPATIGQGLWPCEVSAMCAGHGSQPSVTRRVLNSKS